ncbi:PqqD family peptide modification chaperone [Sulfitobacter sp. JB4-11]|uniref:PqqD family peptide modification chaperone n=1 Tax=Sulfitobacter rhodophyticola TaxID=3238304 RepID=UPI0035176FB9
MSAQSDEKPITLKSEVQRNEQVFSANVGEDLVVFDHETGTYYGSGPVGDAIWRLTEEPIAVSDICMELQEKFEVDQATCETEALQYLTQLHDNQLLTIC